MVTLIHELCNYIFSAPLAIAILCVCHGLVKLLWQMASVIKEGYIEKWCDDKKSFRPIYAKLLSNGNFQWFETADSPSALCSIDVKVIFCYCYNTHCSKDRFGIFSVWRSFKSSSMQATSIHWIRRWSIFRYSTWITSWYACYVFQMHKQSWNGVNC